LTLKGLSWGIPLAAIMFFALAVQAQEVNLTCKDNDTKVEGRVTFDQSAGTAGFAAYGKPPVSPATFTDTEITWAYTYRGGSGRTGFVLSRTTGTLMDDGRHRWTCEVAEKKF
jgi:hypothetical protein